LNRAPGAVNYFPAQNSVLAKNPTLIIEKKNDKTPGGITARDIEVNDFGQVRRFSLFAFC
jgi:hypothetical protein